METQQKTGLYFLLEPDKKERFRRAALQSHSTMSAELNGFIDRYLNNKETNEDE